MYPNINYQVVRHVHLLLNDWGINHIYYLCKYGQFGIVLNMQYKNPHITFTLYLYLQASVIPTI